MHNYQRQTYDTDIKVFTGTFDECYFQESKLYYSVKSKTSFLHFE